MMPLKHRTGSKASSRPVAHPSRSSRSSHVMSSCTAQDFRQDSSRSRNYSPAQIVRAQPSRTSPMDNYSYDVSAFAPNRGAVTDCSTSFVTDDMSYIPATSWGGSIRPENAMLENFQTYWPESYSQSASSSSSIDPMAIDPGHVVPSIFPDLSGSSAAFGSVSSMDDLSSPSFPFDSGNATVMSPPTSPEDGASPDLVGYDFTGEYPANFALSYGQAPVLGEPPSPPSSDPDVYFPLGPISAPLYLGTERSDYAQRSYSSSPSSSPGLSSKATHAISSGSHVHSRPVPRMLKPKSRTHSQEAQEAASAGQPKHKEKPGVIQPRSHHLYKAQPGDDGRYACPFAKETRCSHQPTKQKCGYE